MQVSESLRACPPAIAAAAAALLWMAACDTPRAESNLPKSPFPRVTKVDISRSGSQPSVTSLSPDSATAMSGAFTLTVNGTHLTSSSLVLWNGAARPTVFVGSSQVTASISDSDLAFTGTAMVTVSDPAAGGAVSNPASFDVLSPGQAFPAVENWNVFVGGPPKEFLRGERWLAIQWSRTVRC